MYVKLFTFYFYNFILFLYLRDMPEYATFARTLWFIFLSILGYQLV